MIWFGGASSLLSFSSHTFQPSRALAKVVGLTTTLLSGRVMHPEQDWLPISIPQTYLTSAPEASEADAVVSIRHLIFCVLPLPCSPLRCHLALGSASENPGQLERASAHLGSAIWPRRLPFEQLRAVATSLIDS